MLLMNVSLAADDQSDYWSPEDLRAHMHYRRRLDEDLIASGEMVQSQALSAPGGARIVRAGNEGAHAVTDGPFPECREFLAGYWIVDVDGPERAYEIAGTLSYAPGYRGCPVRLPIEVRQVMSAPRDQPMADSVHPPILSRIRPRM